MNTIDYQTAWKEMPMMRPMFELTKDVNRGGTVHKKGTVLYGLDDRRTFVVSGAGNISVPLTIVKFIGYGDARETFQNTFY